MKYRWPTNGLRCPTLRKNSDYCIDIWSLHKIMKHRLHVFLETLGGDAIGPLGVADNSLLAVGKPLCIRSKKYQVRYGQYCAHHPDAGGNHQRCLPAQPRPERMNDGYVPVTWETIGIHQIRCFIRDAFLLLCLL